MVHFPAGEHHCQCLRSSDFGTQTFCDFLSSLSSIITSWLTLESTSLLRVWFSPALKRVCGSLWFSDIILVVAYWFCQCSQSRRWPSTPACPVTDKNDDGSTSLPFITVDVSRGNAFDLRIKNTPDVFIIDDSFVLSQESDQKEFIK